MTWISQSIQADFLNATAVKTWSAVWIYETIKSVDENRIPNLILISTGTERGLQTEIIMMTAADRNRHFPIATLHGPKIQVNFQTVNVLGSDHFTDLRRFVDKNDNFLNSSLFGN